MSRVGEYLLSVVAAAILVSISESFSDKKSVISSLIKLITGLVLVAVVISPWRNISLTNLSNAVSDYKISASAIVEQGENMAQAEIRSYIKDHSQAYILDKASALALDVSVDVSISDESIPTIQAVAISGNASPYAKMRLINVICNDFGVSEEEIVWS